MGVAHDNTYGSKGSNFNWQNRVLMLLGDIAASLPGNDYELRVTPYKANTNGTGYSTGNFISRTDIINAGTGVILSTLWFNETTGLAIAAPPIGNLDPYIPPSSVTVSNLPAALGQAVMAQSVSVTIASNQTPVPISINQTTPGTTDSVTVKASEGIGSLTEASPATDTASSGLNGRLQRLAQRITSLIGLFPTTLGQGTMAQSLKVVVASDQSPIPVTYSTTGSGNATGALRVELANNGTGVLGLNAGTNTIGNVILVPTADYNLAPSQFNSLTVNSTAQVIKGSSGNIYGWNIINLHSATIYVKIYNIAAASVNPASSVPVRRIPVQANGYVFVEPVCIIGGYSTAISVRCVTESADTGTTAPATLPIIEIMYK